LRFPDDAALKSVDERDRAGVAVLETARASPLGQDTERGSQVLARDQVSAGFVAAGLLRSLLRPLVGGAPSDERMIIPWGSPSPSGPSAFDELSGGGPVNDPGWMPPAPCREMSP